MKNAAALLLLLTIAGCDAARDPQTVSCDFQCVVDALRLEYGIPGITAAYVLNDGTMGTAAAGFADVEAGIAMTSDSRMLAASIGKTFVGATAVSLARDGVLDLDAPVSRWLRDRAWFSRLPNGDAITLRHLLNHTSGLSDHVQMADFATALSQAWQEPDNPFPPDTLIQFVLDHPPLFEAGSGWSYSDTGYILVGLLIEQAAGRSYYDEVRARFLLPLALTQTGPSNTRVIEGLAAGYMSPENPFGFPGRTTTRDGALHWNPAIEWTGGGMVSTSSDLARWAAALFGGRAMPGNYLDDLLASVAVNPTMPGMRYGAGVSVQTDGAFGPVFGHAGWIPGYLSSLRYYQAHGIAIAFQINTDIRVHAGGSWTVSDVERRLADALIAGGRD